MKKKILNLIFFIGGFFIGIVAFSFMARQASFSYADSIRVNYQIEQQIMAIKAKNNKDYKDAVNHYKNIAESLSSLECFKRSNDIWTLSYPIAAFINRLIGIGQIERSKKDEGIYRTLLSDALAKNGELNESIVELKKASILLGLDGDIDRVKAIGKVILKSEELLLPQKDNSNRQKM